MGLVQPTVGKGWLSFELTGQADHAAGESVGHILNPEGGSIIVTRCVVYGITNSTGAANLTIGVGATVAAAHDDATIFAAAAQAASAGTAVEGLAHGDPADALPVVTAGQYIVACTSATSVGYTGRVHLEYIHI